ncbi:MAG: outer membrane beta-barrel protein [Roseovarius sp.]
MMKQFSLIAVATLAAAPALAGSLDPAPVEQPIVQAAPPPDPRPDWTGFYVGGQLGWADVSVNAPGINGDDFTAGITAGYDYDFGDFVLGAGIDYDMADVGLAPGVKLDNVFRAKVRGGLKVGNGLSYVTGGYAEADISPLGNQDGYFVGIGYEQMVTDQFSLALEGLHHEFDNIGGTPFDAEARTVNVRGTFRF